MVRGVLVRLMPAASSLTCLLKVRNLPHVPGAYLSSHCIECAILYIYIYIVVRSRHISLAGPDSNVCWVSDHSFTGCTPNSRYWEASLRLSIATAYLDWDTTDVKFFKFLLVFMVAGWRWPTESYTQHMLTALPWKQWRAAKNEAWYATYTMFVETAANVGRPEPTNIIMSCLPSASSGSAQVL